MKKAGMVCCSNGERRESTQIHHRLTEQLAEHGIEAKFSPFLYGEDGGPSGTGAQRGEAVNAMFRDPEMEAVYDLSGGDLANEVLEYLDYPAIARSGKRLWGYSDLTTVLNAIYAKTGSPSVLYQIKNLVGPCGAEQRERFFSEDHRALFDLPVHFLRGERMEGVLVGGNIRCFLKLAGTEYFPDVTGKLLLLEANSGRVPQMITYLSQLRQMGVFHKVNGIVLGTFTQMKRENCHPTMEELVLERVDAGIPVAKTDKIGHGPDARAAVIGRSYLLEKE